MKKSSLINVYDLNTVANPCNQELREIISLTSFSLAHVVMIPGNKSLPHKHLKMHEIYYILSGKGTFYRNEERFDIKKGSCIVLPPDTTHFLHNDGQDDLEHLVIAMPPFDPADVVLEKNKLNDSYREIFTERKKGNQGIIAPDGGIVDELLSPEQCEAFQISVASGYLPDHKKATPHHHKRGEEIYYIIGGKGKVVTDHLDAPVKQDDIVHIPAGTTHALENFLAKPLEVLCISTPPYTDDDFF